MMKRMITKVNKVRERRYIEQLDGVQSITHMFPVPKGETDIRMVYNGTSSGLNAALWAPHFGLPMVEHTLRSLLGGYHQADLDVAEMFLCFKIHPDLRPYAGVDVKLVKNRRPESWEVGRNRDFEAWYRNFMGMKDSPYRSIQMMLMAKVEAYGDRNQHDNPFGWDRVVLNLPADKHYDSTLPKVFKVRRDYHIASEIYVYVDDARVTAWCKEECWRATCQFSRTLTRLGIQDASRKRTEASMKPGPWAGTNTLTADNVVLITVSQVKWKKSQDLVNELEEMLRLPNKLLRKRLEQIRGFLMYMARSYRWMKPFLKGLHLTIDSWRPQRDSEGYRVILSAAAMRQAEKDMENGLEVNLDAFVGEEDQHGEEEEAPEFVKAVPRLKEDVRALKKFLEGETPAVCKVRVGGVVVGYLMGDASGNGFGSGLWDENGLEYETGRWKGKWRNQSSNFREACNITRKIEEYAKEGKLNDRELYVFTDNEVFEGTFYKGHSKTSAKLTELSRRLHMVERKHGCIIHVVHVAGTRMKASGVDGLSRGDLLEGIMKGKDPWSFVPINRNANQVSNDRAEAWVRSWWSNQAKVPWFMDVVTQSCGVREFADVRAEVLAEAIALKELAVNYMHPEIGVTRVDGAAFGRNYFNRASAPETENVEVKPKESSSVDASTLQPLAAAVKGANLPSTRSAKLDMDIEKGKMYESMELVKLEPEDWFLLHEIKGHRLWIPPPAAMDTVLELFTEDRHMNPHLTHVFVVPRLMTHLWRKQLFKDADLKFYVKAGAPFWPCSMHEPLTVVVVLPLAYTPSYRGPWSVKQTPDSESAGNFLDALYGDYEADGREKCYDLESPMPPLWEDEQRWTRDFLFQFLREKSQFPPVQSGLLRSLLPSLRGRPLPDPDESGGRGR